MTLNISEPVSLYLWICSNDIYFSYFTGEDQINYVFCYLQTNHYRNTVYYYYVIKYSIQREILWNMWIEWKFTWQYYCSNVFISLVKSLSRVQLFATPWTAAYQAPLSMGFSRQEYWSGVPSPSPREIQMYFISTIKLTIALFFKYLIINIPKVQSNTAYSYFCCSVQKLTTLFCHHKMNYLSS